MDPKHCLVDSVTNAPMASFPWNLPVSGTDATILTCMSTEQPNRPRVGIPWRTSREEADNNRPKIRNYEEAVRKAGGEPVLLSLTDSPRLQSQLPELDAFVLPGSPADVEPTEYGAVNSGKSAPADLPREATDRTILEHAFAEKKPVLAICYGCQLLNVYLGGTLIQDLRTELGTTLPHGKPEPSQPGASPPERKEDPVHASSFEAGSKLAAIAGSLEAQINSSHHQAVAKPGKNLRITAHAPDGTVEAVEWTGDSNWVIGVQWHPERSSRDASGDAFSERLFHEFVLAAGRVQARNTAVPEQK
jgi:putative glutamine amidotransferase